VGAPVRLCGVTLAVSEPSTVAERWAHVLGVAVAEEGRPVLRLDGAEVGFVSAAERHEEGLIEIAVEYTGDAPAPRAPVALGGVHLLVRPSPGSP